MKQTWICGQNQKTSISKLINLKCVVFGSSHVHNLLLSLFYQSELASALSHHGLYPNPGMIALPKILPQILEQSSQDHWHLRPEVGGPSLLLQPMHGFLHCHQQLSLWKTTIRKMKWKGSFSFFIQGRCFIWAQKLPSWSISSTYPPWINENRGSSVPSSTPNDGNFIRSLNSIVYAPVHWLPLKDSTQIAELSKQHNNHVLLHQKK